MNNLSSIKKDFRIVPLNEADAKFESDHLHNLEKLVLANEDMYPNIDQWLSGKVIPGLKTTERAAWVGYMDEKPLVSAIVKRGKHSKFCHLRISDDFQDKNLGEIFFCLMALEVRNMAEEIHFTLPKSLWDEKKKFFQSFRFHDAIKAGTQYRIFDMELRCSSSFSDVWKAVLDKLSKIAEIFSAGGYSLGNNLVISFRPEYTKKILNGEKKVEIRRKFATKWKGHRISLYSSSPIQSLVGEAIIDNVIIGEPDYIWEKFNSDICGTKEEFDKYVASKNEIYAIILDDVRPFKLEIPRSQVSHLLNQDLKPPQSYCSLKNNKPWAEAVSIAALLQANFRNTIVHSQL
ncbi:hypothetical protein ACFL4Z_02195 [candidate division KSB1 bacterium]